MQGFWRVTIKYVNIRVIYTLYKFVHSRTWSILWWRIDINVNWAVCGMWSTNIITAQRLKLYSRQYSTRCTMSYWSSNIYCGLSLGLDIWLGTVSIWYVEPRSSSGFHGINTGYWVWVTLCVGHTHWNITNCVYRRTIKVLHWYNTKGGLLLKKLLT